MVVVFVNEHATQATQNSLSQVSLDHFKNGLWGSIEKVVSLKARFSQSTKPTYKKDYFTKDISNSRYGNCCSPHRGEKAESLQWKLAVPYSFSAISILKDHLNSTLSHNLCPTGDVYSG